MCGELTERLPLRRASCPEALADRAVAECRGQVRVQGDNMHVILFMRHAPGALHCSVSNSRVFVVHICYLFAYIQYKTYSRLEKAGNNQGSSLSIEKTKWRKKHKTMRPPTPVSDHVRDTIKSSRPVILGICCQHLWPPQFLSNSTHQNLSTPGVGTRQP